MSMFLITGGFEQYSTQRMLILENYFTSTYHSAFMLTFICSVMVLCHCLFEGKLAQGLGIGLPIIFFFMTCQQLRRQL